MAAAGAAALALVGASASAQPAPPPSDNAVVPQAVIGGDYSYLDVGNGFGHANVYGGELGGAMPITGDFSGQLTGGYHRIDASGFGADDWNVAGAAAWSPPWGRLGANVGYSKTSVLGASASVTNYGVYGEYFADQFTVGLRGGGATISARALGLGGSTTGGYGGGEAIGYVMPDLAVKGTVGYVGINGGHQWTAGVHGEYLISEATPISGWVGYDYDQLGAGGFGSVRANTFSVGLKYYFGGGGSLQHHQRTGVDDWGPSQLDLNR